MVTHPGVAARMFGALAEAGVNIEMISTSEIKISCLVRADRVEPAVRAVHDAFGLGGGVQGASRAAEGEGSAGVASAG